MSTNRFMQSSSGAARRTGLRAARRAMLAAAMLSAAVVPGGAAHAQDAGARFELRPFVGAYVPTGDQRDLLEESAFVGAQVSWRVRPSLAITGTAGWVSSRDRLTPGEQKIDLYQYDVGAELRAASWIVGEGWDFTPFVGLGAGGRTYDYRDLDVDAKTNFAGYGALGGDLGLGAVALRLEARNYVSRFEPLTGTGESGTRNDLGIAAGLSYRF